jgi:hypothetical protein
MFFVIGDVGIAGAGCKEQAETELRRREPAATTSDFPNASAMYGSPTQKTFIDNR